MSNAAADVEVRLKFVDKGATSAIAKYAKEVEKSTKQAETAVTQSNTRQRNSYDRLSQARESLGVRSEKKIQLEISRTESAYKRLEASGTLSQAQLARAADKTKSKITTLTNEMGKLTHEQEKAARAAKEFEKNQGRLRFGASAAVGVGAAGYALKGPIGKAMSFDEMLVSMSNTAFAERDARGRIAGSKDLESVINRSIDLKRGGGGTRDQAAEALSAMLGKGTLGFQRSMDFLPTVMRTATGASANPLDIAELSSALYGQGVVKSDRELKTALNMITASGQAGGFEIKDLSKHLPGQLAVGKSAGMTGLDGLQKILTMNQAAVLTSAGNDDAGNNVKNLLSKLASSDTAKDFEKSGRGDLAQFLVKQRLKGIDAVDAWQNLIDKEAEKSPVLKTALTKLKASKDKTEQASLIESISQLSEGNVIGQFFQDMQARSALFGMRNKDVVGRVDSAIGKNRTEFGANDVNWETMAGTTSAQVRNAEQEAQIAQKTAMDKLTPTISKTAELFTDLAQKFPGMTSATIATVPPLIALAGAAGVSALALGGGAAGGGGIAAKGASMLSKLGSRGSLLGGAALAGSVAVDAVTEKDSALNRYGSAALRGAGTGMLLGSVVPGIGNATGAAVGSIGALIAQAITDFSANKTPEPQPPTELNAKFELLAPPGFQFISKGMQTTGPGNVNVNTGNVFNGAP